jgi:hypothetical protein
LVANLRVHSIADTAARTCQTPLPLRGVMSRRFFVGLALRALGEMPNSPL